jgi:hypothetical protein
LEIPSGKMVETEIDQSRAEMEGCDVEGKRKKKEG